MNARRRGREELAACILRTVDRQTFPIVRPIVAVMERDEETCIEQWFLTSNVHLRVVFSLRAAPGATRAVVTMSNPEGGQYVRGGYRELALAAVEGCANG